MSRDASDLGHILVVDDEEPVRDVLCEYLESQGFGVDFSYLDRAVSAGLLQGSHTPGSAGASAAPAAPWPARVGQWREAGQHLGELALILAIAAELGDLTGPDLAAVESALASARRALSPAG